MKKLVVLMVAITLGLTTAVSAKMLPTTAAKLPADFKQEISKHLNYPKDAQNNYVEGEVWLKITLDENSKVRIVDLSATVPELGIYVEKKLSDLTIKNTSFPIGNVYFMKVKFDLLD
ncbi:MAG: hypothetical protein JEZ09_18485 [Salinivirgaceae bacterium]|nr:hypothetical protein [Salinivirgaceae bacterium]